MTAYPGGLDSITTSITGSQTLGSVPHSTVTNLVNGAVNAIEAKVGIGASTPAANTVLTSTGTGNSTWNPRPGMLPSGYAQVTANQTAITTLVDLTGLTVTVNVPAGATIKITGYIPHFASGEANDTFSLYIYEGSTQLSLSVNQTVTDGSGVPPCMVILTPTAGSHTYKLSAAANGSLPSLTMEASTASPAFILVELI